MQVKILEEAGYNSALYGFSLSYKDRAIKPDDWWGFCGTCNGRHPLVPGSCTSCEGMLADKGVWARKTKIQKTATANAPRGKGHNKFLRQIKLWIDIEAPRYFWSEFDTYKIGTVAQSESTMHTLSRRDMVGADLESKPYDKKYQIHQVALFNKVKDSGAALSDLKKYLPEAYLQRRVVTMNYEVLRQIIKQRKKHKLPEWTTFINEIMGQVEHPELLEDLL